MAFKLCNNVQEITTTAGTGPITVAGAVNGARAFSSQLSAGDKTILVIKDDTDEECCYATYVSANVFSRDTVIWSTNANALVNWSSGGTRDVIASIPGNVLEALLDPSSFSVARAASFTGVVTQGSNSASIITPHVISFNSTTVIDLSKASIKKTTVTGDFAAVAGLTTSNRVAGAMADIRMIASGGPWNFPTSGAGFFADWVWMTAVPTTLAAGKNGVLTLKCYGTAETDVLAWWQFQP